MAIHANDGAWKEIITPHANDGGAWKLANSVHVKHAGIWESVWPLPIPATCLITMKTSTVPSPGTLYNVNGYWAYSETASPDAVGPGSNSINWNSFGSYSGSSGARSHSVNVDYRSLGSNGWYTNDSSHSHAQSHTHPSSTSSRYPARLDLRQYYGCNSFPIGSVVFSRDAIIHPSLTIASSTYNSNYVRIITGAPGGTVGAVTASKSHALNCSSGGASLVQNSYLRGVYFYSGHYHSMTHTHTVSPNPLYRYYRMYDVTAPISGVEDLPSGSMLMAYSTVGWPVGWTPYTTGYLLRIADSTTTASANGGVTTQTISKTAFTSGARTGGTAREFEAGSERYSISGSSHTINTHTHASSVTAYPLTRKILFMEKA